MSERTGNLPVLPSGWDWCWSDLHEVGAADAFGNEIKLTATRTGAARIDIAQCAPDAVVDLVLARWRSLRDGGTP